VPNIAEALKSVTSVLSHSVINTWINNNNKFAQAVRRRRGDGPEKDLSWS
jgi:hypothetical protein